MNSLRQQSNQLQKQGKRPEIINQIPDASLSLYRSHFKLTILHDIYLVDHLQEF